MTEDVRYRYLSDETKARLPEEAADLISDLRKEIDRLRKITPGVENSYKFLFWTVRPNTCKARGCGHEQQGNDNLCAICRKPL